MATKFNYPVTLIKLEIENLSQEEAKVKLNEVPYLLYEVATLSDGRKIVINKPGGKRNFGRLSKNDFMVFVHNPVEEELWLASHAELQEDIEFKFSQSLEYGKVIIELLHKVCKGEELQAEEINSIESNIGLSLDLLIHLYKWIWFQEDVNYPNGLGRWLSMNNLLELSQTKLNT
ncbi:MAG: hypothetical protein MUC59_04280 [Saprospiraceae bacterium]|jgi:hypothetical protein|nr:hypothetical protein [Saprospiraceae bacterium]